MSPAAIARAAAEAALTAKAETEAQAELARPAVRIRPSYTPIPETPAMTPRPVSPAALRRSYLIASTAGGVLAASGVQLSMTGANDDGAPGAELESAAAVILLQMQEDRRRLKDIASIERKIEFKRGLIPTYEGWCDGVMAAGKSERIGLLDDLFTTVMAWRIDVGDYLPALQMAEHCFRHALPMPERFKRGTAAFVVEQISEAAIRAYEAGVDEGKAFPAAVLPMLQDLIATYDEDLHDEISAKLSRAIGMAILNGADFEDENDLRVRRENALKCYLRALQLNPKVGVKKHVEQLQRQLKTGAPAPVVTEPASASASPSESTEPAGGAAAAEGTVTSDAAEASAEDQAAGQTEQNTSAPQKTD